MDRKVFAHDVKSGDTELKNMGILHCNVARLIDGSWHGHLDVIESYE